MNKNTKTALTLLTGFILSGQILAQNTIPVQVQSLSEVLVDLQRNAPADVRSLNATTLSAEVDGVVAEIKADVGQQVNKGDVLVELDDTDYRLALQQAEANLAASQAQKQQADARLKRGRELGANQYMSADDLLIRETDVLVIAARIKLQQASVAIARRNLEKCRILAPFKGAVMDRLAQRGTFVTRGNSLLTITQLDEFELHAEIPDELTDSLLGAQRYEFVSRNESWPIELLRLSPVIDTNRRSRQARFAFTADHASIGRSGNLVWYVEKGLLPVNLVVRREGVLGVFLNESGVARFTPLPAAQEGRPVAVELPMESEIVVQGRERLQNGDRISPVRAAGR